MYFKSSLMGNGYFQMELTMMSSQQALFLPVLLPVPSHWVFNESVLTNKFFDPPNALGKK